MLYEGFEYRFTKVAKIPPDGCLSYTCIFITFIAIDTHI